MIVRDLIKFLSNFPEDVEVYSIGPDCGGYECELGLLNSCGTLESLGLNTDLAYVDIPPHSVIIYHSA